MRDTCKMISVTERKIWVKVKMFGGGGGQALVLLKVSEYLRM